MSTAGLTEELRLVEEDLTRLQTTAAACGGVSVTGTTSRPTPRSGRR